MDLHFPVPSVIARTERHALVYDRAQPSKNFVVWEVSNTRACRPLGAYEKRGAALLAFIMWTINAEGAWDQEQMRDLRRWLQPLAREVDAVVLTHEEIYEFCEIYHDEIDPSILHQAAESQDFSPEIENALTAIMGAIETIREPGSEAE